nr:hypothetical protein [Mycobacterium branderi]
MGDLTAKHSGGVLQDPVKLALRDRRAEHRRHPVNLSGRQPGPQLRDTVTNLGGVIDVGFGLAPPTQQAIAVPRPVDQLVHRAAARAFTDSRLPTLHRTGSADALLELARIDFRIIAAQGTPRRSNTHGAELAQTQDQRLDVGGAVAAAGPGEHATVAPQRSRQPLQLRGRQAHPLDRGADIVVAQVRLDRAHCRDDHRHELAAVSAHPPA